MLYSVSVAAIEAQFEAVLSDTDLFVLANADVAAAAAEEWQRYCLMIRCLQA